MQSERAVLINSEIYEYIKCLECEKAALEKKDTSQLNEIILKKQKIIEKIESFKLETVDTAEFLKALEPLKQYIQLQEANIQLLEKEIEDTRLELASMDEQFKRLTAYRKMIESS